MPTIGENIRKLREKAGFRTQKAFAEAMGEKLPRVNEWENDRYALPDTATLLRIAKFLSVSIDDLLAGVDPGYDRAAGSTAALPAPAAIDLLMEQLRHLTGGGTPAKKRGRSPEKVFKTAEEVLAEVRAITARVAEQGAEQGNAGAIVDVSGYVVDDLPVIAEGEASPQGTLFWDDQGKLLAHVTSRVTRPFDVRDPLAYGVLVRGDSMLPVYVPGVVVVVSPSRPVTDGARVYVELTSGERLIKVARKADEGWLLESTNPAHPPRFVKKKDVRFMHRIVWSKEPVEGEQVLDEVTGRKVRRQK